MTHHDDITRSDADLVMAASIERIQSPVVDNLHRRLLLLLLKATERHLLVKQAGTWGFVNCKPTEIL